jgi:hypothetical protein
MKQRYGKWLADCRDATGKRHRKAFESRTTALRFQDKMQSTASSKKARTRAHSATSPAPEKHAVLFPGFPRRGTIHRARIPVGA